MKHTLGGSPRPFSPLPGIQLKDVGTIELSPDEQVTFKLESGRKNDIVRKKWGFYLPIQYNTHKQLWIGGAIKAGPLLIGLHNWAYLFSKKSIQNGGGWLALRWSGEGYIPYFDKYKEMKAGIAAPLDDLVKSSKVPWLANLKDAYITPRIADAELSNEVAHQRLIADMALIKMGLLRHQAA